jgi:hypothetical protein
MSGRGVNSDSVAPNAAPVHASVPFYDWKFHPGNKWWTFNKDHGKTNNRFGRFERGQFITGNPSTPAPPSAPPFLPPIAIGSAQNPITIDD